MNLSAIVLCGGESRRMGQDKASLPLAGETMLARVARLAAEAAGTVVVAASPRQVLPELPAHIRVVRDPWSEMGPWQGIAAGLRAVADADAVFVVACDSPFLVPGWIRLLADAIGDCVCAVPFVDGCWQPLAALYRPRAVDVVEQLLSEGRWPLELFDLVPTRRVTADELRAVDPELRTLRNLNSPEDYRLARLSLGETEPD